MQFYNFKYNKYFDRDVTNKINSMYQYFNETSNPKQITVYNSWFLVYLLSLLLLSSIFYIGLNENMEQSVCDSQIGINTGMTTTTNTNYMTTITPPLAMPQRQKGVVMKSHHQLGTITSVPSHQLETKYMEHQLSLPLVTHGQGNITDGEPIARSPIKVDVRVQFIPKQSCKNKPKTKKIKRDQNINSSSDDEDGNDLD